MLRYRSPRLLDAFKIETTYYFYRTAFEGFLTKASRRLQDRDKLSYAFGVYNAFSPRLLDAFKIEALRRST